MLGGHPLEQLRQRRGDGDLGVDLGGDVDGGGLDERPCAFVGRGGVQPSDRRRGVRGAQRGEQAEEAALVRSEGLLVVQRG
ncbi:hypothetical protein ACWEQU_14025, partial [Streptomyces nodosus]